MNIHETRTYTFTTGSETADGAALDLEALPPPSQLLESQCTVQAEVPPGVHLRVLASATHAQVLVEGGLLPAGTALRGVLSVVSSRP